MQPRPDQYSRPVLSWISGNTASLKLAPPSWQKCPAEGFQRLSRPALSGPDKFCRNQLELAQSQLRVAQAPWLIAGVLSSRQIRQAQPCAAPVCVDSAGRRRKLLEPRLPSKAMNTLLAFLIPVGITVFGCWAMTRGGPADAGARSPKTTDDIVDPSALTAISLVTASSEIPCSSDSPASSDCSTQ
jgi:hypothetical protein